MFRRAGPLSEEKQEGAARRRLEREVRCHGVVIGRRKANGQGCLLHESCHAHR